MSKTPIELKGSSFTLSVVHLHDSRPDVIQKALEDKVAKAPSFLKQAPVVLNVAHLEAPINWHHIKQAVISAGLHIVGVSGCKDETLKAEVLRANLPLMTEGKEKIPHSNIPDTAPATLEKMTTPALFIDTPIRSGQRIYAKDTDLIIANHVSAGAELIADGNIHVYGALRGRALAGASGDESAHVFCTNLLAELVSIAGKYRLSDEIPADYYGKATRVSLSNGSLFFQSLI